MEFEENVVAYSFSANRCGGGWLSVSDHGARGKRWGGSRKKAEKDKELEDIFASDIWRIESRIDTGQNDVSKGRECTACCLTVNIFTIVCRVYYIRVKRWNSVLLVYVIYSYVNWELCFDSVLFVPSRDITFVQRSLFLFPSIKFYSFLLYLSSSRSKLFLLVKKKGFFF